MVEAIVAASVRVGGREFDGANHALATMAAIDALGHDDLSGDCGFRTSLGRFVGRSEAKDILYGRPVGSGDEADDLIAEELAA